METLRARAEGFYVATMPVPEEAARLMADYLRDEMTHAQRQYASCAALRPRYLTRA